MPRCEACPNRSGKGIKVCYFPRDEVLRNMWVQKLNKKDWTPTKHAVLCALHFAPEMWEKVREDGTKKLKRNEVPTIFNRATDLVEDETPSQQNRMDDKGTHIDNITPVVEDDDPDRNISLVPLIKIKNEENQDEPEAERKEVELETEIDRKVPENFNSEEELEQEKDLESLPQDCERKILSGHPDYQQLKKMYEKSERFRTIMKKKHKETRRKLQRRIKQLEQEVRVNDQRTSCIKKLLNDDQVEVLNRQMKKVSKWSDATLVVGYELKFSCGNTGYTNLIKKGWPLPSIRTLRRKLENWKFQSGISDQVFKFLSIKAAEFKSDIDNDCVIVLDEASITSGEIYDSSVNSYVGTVTLPNHSGIGTHGLVFMLAGIGHKWKQVIAYYYTGNKVNGSSFKEIIVEIIQRAEAIGLRVNGVVSDMGSANRAMWKAFGINAGRYTVPHNSCVHPFDGNRNLFFFHDAPHALKNLKEGLLNNNYMTIPETFVKFYNLISNKVSVKHFDELISKQKHLQFLLTPKLRKEYLEKNRHFLKMRVASASSVFSHDVSSALQLIADEDETPELGQHLGLLGSSQDGSRL